MNVLLCRPRTALMTSRTIGPFVSIAAAKRGLRDLVGEVPRRWEQAKERWDVATFRGPPGWYESHYGDDTPSGSWVIVRPCQDGGKDAAS